MVIDKIFVNNATRLSLSERFTILQTVQPVLAPRRNRARETYDSYDVSHPANIRSSRLMERLGMTPMARAALELKKVPLKHRIGKIPQRAPNSQNLYRNGALLISPGKNKGRRSLGRSRSFSNLTRGRRRSLSRANSVGNLSRSSSFGDLSGASGDEGFYRPRRPRWRGRGGFRYRGQSRNSGDGGGGGGGWNSGRGRGRGRGQWRGRGQGRGRGRGGWNRSNEPPPNKDDLDRELDQYMAGSKAQLDRELDSYMVNSMDISY